MFRDTIKGLETVFENEPPKGHIILVIGEPGTLKSAFVYNVMSNYLSSHSRETGIYMTLEEKKDSHVRNMTGLGIKQCPSLQVYDFASLMIELKGAEGSETETPTPSDYVDLILDRIWKTSTGIAKHDPLGLPEKGDKLTPVCFALDSLNAFQSLARIDEQAFRDRMFEFFSRLRDNNAFNFIIYEADGHMYRPEFYLVDGIVELGVRKSTMGLKRYIQVKKMKSVRHSLEQYAVDITPNGIEIVKPIID